MKGTHLLGLNHLICTFDQKLTPACVCPSLDILHRSITQHDGFNNLNFMGGGGDISIKGTHQDLVFG